ncbi:MAG TPA: type II toxin-antitoxin system HicA family toxin [Methanotrichaceae archaeon]|nr:type II toxin-antitoxin system HicA family toxin [Methanotrichaceae archaeon]
MSIRAADLEQAARKKGFLKINQSGGHARWKYLDVRATTIPIHGDDDIGGWLAHEILEQLGLTEEELEELL